MLLMALIPQLKGQCITLHQQASSFSVALRPQRPYGPLGSRSPGRLPQTSDSFVSLFEGHFASLKTLDF